MPDIIMDNCHKQGLRQLGDSLKNNFERIDKDRNHFLSKEELRESTTDNRLGAAESKLAQFALDHFEDISRLYGRARPDLPTADRLPMVDLSPKEKGVSMDDINTMLRATGDTKAKDPFARNRSQYALVNGLVEAGCGAYVGRAFFVAGPLAGVAGVAGGAAVGEGVGYSAFRVLHRVLYGSSDNYYKSAGRALQRMDVSDLCR